VNDLDSLGGGKEDVCGGGRDIYEIWVKPRNSKLFEK
jgi:hypothetical protein